MSYAVGSTLLVALDATDPAVVGRVLAVVLPVAALGLVAVIWLILWPLTRAQPDRGARRSGSEPAGSQEAGRAKAA